MDLTPPTAIGIVGGGLAAVQAIETLRRLGYDGRLSLVCDEPELPYDRPPLSKDALVAEGPVPAAALLAPQRWEELAVEVVLGDRATRLDPGGSRIELASGRAVAVDRVLLATGGRARSLPVPGADLAGVTGLRTLAEARLLRDLLVQGGPVVVVGAGFIGLEVAAAARARGCDVTVVEAADRPLARVLSRPWGEFFAAAHRERGVRLVVDAQVASIEGPARAETVVLSDGRRIPARVVVVGIGMVPSDELAREAGLAVADGILTDDLLRTGNPHVLAAGDVARVSGRGRVEQWQSAQVQGQAAAHTLLGRTPPVPPAPWFWSDQGDLSLQVAGTPAAGDRIVSRGTPDAGERCSFHLDGDRLVGAVAVNRAQDVRGAMALIESGRTAPDDVLADPAQDLRRWVRQQARSAR